MQSFKHIYFLLVCLACTELVYSQSLFSPEIGFISGPVQLRSDYGVRNDKNTNLGNSGFGIGFMSYLNFSSTRKYKYWNSSSYFDDHFKVRTEISWNRTKLEHIGEWVASDRTTVEADKLRSHKGENRNFNFGFQIEYSPYSIRRFESFSPRIWPYIGLGVHYVFYTAEVSTSYNNPNPNLIGNVLEPTNFYSSWEPGSVKPSAGSTPSLVSSIGTRYKYNKVGDIIIELRGQYFLSDWVDGLNHQLESNMYNDWVLWLNVGYIMYLD